MRDEHDHGQYGVVAAAIASAEDVDTVAGDLSESGRGRSVVAHPDRARRFGRDGNSANRGRPCSERFGANGDPVAPKDDKIDINSQSFPLGKKRVDFRKNTKKDNKWR
jgi:hypothetical protein